MKNFTILTVAFLLIVLNTEIASAHPCHKRQKGEKSCIDEIQQCNESGECLLKMVKAAVMESEECQEIMNISNGINMTNEELRKVSKCAGLAITMVFGLHDVLVGIYGEKRAMEITQNIGLCNICETNDKKPGETIKECVARFNVKEGMASTGNRCDSYYYKKEGIGEVYIKIGENPEDLIFEKNVANGITVRFKNNALTVKKKDKVLVKVVFKKTRKGRMVKVTGSAINAKLTMTCE